MARSISLFVSLGCLLAAACAAPTSVEDTNVDVDLDGVEQQAPVSSGGWTLTATQPGQGFDYAVTGYMTVSGPAGQTVAAGVCLLNRVGTPGTNCTTDSQCGTQPDNRCLAPDNSGQKKCYIRRTCTSGLLGPGSYATPSFYATLGKTYVSNACFGVACLPTPSTSVSLQSITDPR